jgi:hypothetical protein
MANEFIARNGLIALDNSTITGSLTVTGGVTTATELQVTTTGVNIGSALTDSHIISGSLRINPNGLFVSGSGNVGIGTTTPGFKLDVNGNVRILGGSTYLGQADIASGHLNAYELMTFNIDVDNDDTNRYFAWYTNAADGAGSELMRLTEAGNVGIGTTSPVAGQGTPLTLVSSAGFVGLTLLGGGSFAHTWQLYASGDGDSNKFFGIYDRTNSTYRLVTTNAGNVGIGTTSPGARLTVNGTNPAFDIQNSGSTYFRAELDGSNFTYLSTLGANDMILRTNSTERMRIISGGNVGIGTSTPTERLSLAGATSTTFGISLTPSGWNNARHRFTVPTSGDVSMLSFNYNGSIVDSALYATSAIYLTQGVLVFLTGGTNAVPTERMRITSGGNVGIGTTPSYRLHVVTDAVAGKQNMSNISRTTGNWVRFTNPQFSTDSSMGLILKSFPDSDGRQGAGIIASGGSNNASTDLDLFVTTSPDGSGGTSYSAIKINGFDGNVGIGTTSPATKFHVANTSSSVLFSQDGTNATIIGADAAGAASQGLFLRGFPLTFTGNGGAGAEAMRITSGGNVGIGTTSPTTKLEVIGGTSNVNGYADGTIQVTSLSPIAFVVPSNLNPSLNRWGFRLREVNEGDFSIYDYRNSVNRVLINSSGNVGIGTTSPATHLHVSSGIHTKLRVDTTGVADASVEILGYDAGVHIGDPTNGNRWVIWNDGVSTSSSLKFGSYALGTWYVDSSQAMTITSGGNVGIGTTDPTNRLHLTGNSATPSLRLGSTSAGFHWDIGRENAVTGDFVFNQTSAGGTAAERLRITQNGITFNGDTAAANALDDYEEGTFTPSIAFGGASVGITYFDRIGNYTKIGRQVTCTIYLALTSKGSSTGNAQITGLPFTASGLNRGTATAGSIRFNDITFVGRLGIQGQQSGTVIDFSQTTEAGVGTSLTNSNFSDSSEMFITITYFTA